MLNYTKYYLFFCPYIDGNNNNNSIPVRQKLKQLKYLQNFILKLFLYPVINFLNLILAKPSQLQWKKENF